MLGGKVIQTPPGGEEGLVDNVLGMVWTCPALDEPQDIGVGQFI